MAQAINVRGLYATYQLLGEVEKDLRREFMHDLGSMLKREVTQGKVGMPVGRQPSVRTRADGTTYKYQRLPKRRPGGIGLKRSTFLTKRGSKRMNQYAPGGRGRGLFGFVAMTGAPHGSILDLAKQGHTKQGKSLVATLNARYGPAPRFLGKQFLGEFNRKRLYRESTRIVDKYVAVANARIEKAATRTVAA